MPYLQAVMKEAMRLIPAMQARRSLCIDSFEMRVTFICDWWVAIGDVEFCSLIDFYWKFLCCVPRMGLKEVALHWIGICLPWTTLFRCIRFPTSFFIIVHFTYFIGSGY